MLVSVISTVMSYREDFDDQENDWDDAIDFGEVTETGSTATDVRNASNFLLSQRNLVYPPFVRL